MEEHSRIFVAGHTGLAGSAIVRKLLDLGYRNLILRRRHEVDLKNADEVNYLFKTAKPEFIFMAAAKVGGILANSECPAEFIEDNLSIQLNVISAAQRCGAKKLQFLGSSCIYPKFAAQPMKEEVLLTGELEPTNEWYAVAKIAGIKLCQAYRLQYGFNAICLMPTNLYGPQDNFDLRYAHVLPALLRKFYEAKEKNDSEVVIWGTGSPRREFLHVDDLAIAAIFLMQGYDSGEIINVGTGVDIPLLELGTLIANVVGYRGKIVFDRSKPDGTPRKLLDVSRIHNLGWHHSIELEDGIKSTYDWFKRNWAVDRASKKFA